MSPIISFLVNVSASPGSCSHGNCSLEEWRLLEAVPAAILVPAPAWCCVLCACSAHSSFTDMCIYICIPIFTFPFSSGKSSENLKVLTDFSGACSAQGHQSWVFSMGIPHQHQGCALITSQQEARTCGIQNTKSWNARAGNSNPGRSCSSAAAGAWFHPSSPGFGFEVGFPSVKTFSDEAADFIRVHKPRRIP